MPPSCCAARSAAAGRCPTGGTRPGSGPTSAGSHVAAQQRDGCRSRRAAAWRSRSGAAPARRLPARPAGGRDPATRGSGSSATSTCGPCRPRGTARPPSGRSPGRRRGSSSPAAATSASCGSTGWHTPAPWPWPGPGPAGARAAPRRSAAVARRPASFRIHACIRCRPACLAEVWPPVIAVRLRYTGWNRANANHASSQRNTRSGLIARHSSITRWTS